jgi:hypothetical protein
MKWMKVQKMFQGRFKFNLNLTLKFKSKSKSATDETFLQLLNVEWHLCKLISIDSLIGIKDSYVSCRKCFTGVKCVTTGNDFSLCVSTDYKIYEAF